MHLQLQRVDHIPMICEKRGQPEYSTLMEGAMGKLWYRVLDLRRITHRRREQSLGILKTYSPSCLSTLVAFNLIAVVDEDGLCDDDGDHCSLDKWGGISIQCFEAGTSPVQAQ